MGSRRRLSGFLCVALLAALPALGRDRDKHRVERSSTETIPFIERGTIRVDDSFGVLEIQGWDKPEVEMSVRRSTQKRYRHTDEGKAIRDLERIVIRTTRSQNTLLIHTIFPGPSLDHPLRGKSNLRLHYTLKVPRHSSLYVRHDIGEVNVRDVGGDLHVTSRIGEVSLKLPEDSDYQVDAKARIGEVSTPLRGRSERSFLVGERFQSPYRREARQVFARVGIGEIRIETQPRQSDTGTLYK